SSTTLLSTGLLCALLPGAALNAPCPGYGFTAVCGPEARVKRRQAADTTDFCSSQSRNTCK
ncbi:hypothetical protein ACS5NX_003999, partial [Klebsiella oxytoca]